MTRSSGIHRAHVVVMFWSSVLAISASSAFLHAQSTSFHNAPASAQQVKNPYAGQAQAARAGKAIYAHNCGACHGNTGQGAGNVPPLARGTAQTASDGAIFWYITQGDVNNGMPSWANMPAKQRWEVVTFLKTLNKAQGAQARASVAPAGAIKISTAPPPFRETRHNSSYQGRGSSRTVRHAIGHGWP